LDKNVEEDNIKKQFKTISRVYEDEDAEFLSAVEQQKRSEKKAVRDKFMSYVKKRRVLWEERKEEREKLYKEPEEEYTDIDYVKEDILKVNEQIVKTD
jgi:hypothetical protein